MNIDEFTAPFDLERWKTGEPALTQNLTLAFYVREKDSNFVYRLSTVGGIQGAEVMDYCKAVFFHDIKNLWKMRPKAEEAEWIPHSGSKCPIPWAKAGEFLLWLRSGPICTSHPANIYRWDNRQNENDIIAFRLTDGWIPIINGKCPQAVGWKTGTWEFKDAGSGEVIEGLCDILPTDFWSSAVAVRQIKKEEIPGLAEAINKFKTLRDFRAEDYLQEIKKKPTPYTAEDFRKEREAQELETLQQKRTREAYLAYKAKHPDPKPVLPIGETEESRIAGAALVAHDRVWPRKS